MSLLVAQNVSVTAGRRTILKPMDLAVRPGEWKGIIGPNGAGKSTLLKAIAGLMTHEGTVLWRGRDVREDAAFFRRCIGVVLHESMLYREMTALENLVFYARLYGLRGATEAVRDAIERVGLTPFADELVGRFSRGMVQRLTLARAMVHRPKLLILDEPLSSVDTAGARDMLRLFHQAKEEQVAGLWVTHQWETAWPVVDEFIELNQGFVIGQTRTASVSQGDWRPTHAGAPVGST